MHQFENTPKALANFSLGFERSREPWEMNSKMQFCGLNPKVVATLQPWAEISERLRSNSKNTFGVPLRFFLCLVAALGVVIAVGCGAVAAHGFLVPASSGSVFLFGATQHGECSLRSQVSARNDDRI